MRVLLIHHAPARTGVASYVSNLRRELEAIHGACVSIADISDPSGLGLVSSPGHKLRRSVELVGGLLRLPGGFDVYHATDQFLSITRALVGPAVVTVHDAAGFLSISDLPWKAEFKLNALAARSAEMIICPSEFARQEAITQLRLKSSRTRVIRHGISGAFFKRDRAECRKRLGLAPEMRAILSVATTLKHKNLPTLLKAFSLVLRQDSKARLIRIGAPNPSTPELDRLARDLGISDAIVYMRATEEMLPLAYNAADVFVHTSTYEGFGFPALEAMASGTPVVTSSAASLPEVVGHAGLIVDPFDAERFAAEMVRILNSRDLAETLSEAGVQRSRAFNWAACARETYEVYRAVAA
jgi:glycosyltransferase involved in cell wall biosynthesis